MAYKREECLEFAKQYIDASRDASAQYDSRMFWLAGGAIGLSAAFLQSIVKNGIVAPALLAAAWACLLAGVLLVLISYQLAIQLYQLWILFWMCHVNDEPDKAGQHRLKAQRLGRCTTRLNWAALVVILLGLVLLCAFVFLNAK